MLGPERAVEIYYLEDGKYDLKYSYILQDDAEEVHYNADTKIVLKEFPHISPVLAEISHNTRKKRRINIRKKRTSFFSLF